MVVTPGRQTAGHFKVAREKAMPVNYSCQCTRTDATSHVHAVTNHDSGLHSPQFRGYRPTRVAFSWFCPRAAYRPQKRRFLEPRQSFWCICELHLESVIFLLLSSYLERTPNLNVRGHSHNLPDCSTNVHKNHLLCVLCTVLYNFYLLLFHCFHSCMFFYSSVFILLFIAMLCHCPFVCVCHIQ